VRRSASAQITDCLAAAGPFVSGPSPSFDIVVPRSATSLVDVLVAACPGRLASASACVDPASGRAFGADEYVVGVKRVFVRATDRNANPILAGVTWDGADWPEIEARDARGCDTGGNRYDTCDAALAHHVAPVVDPASIESGVDELGHAFSDTVVVQYYATEGIFEHEVRLAGDPATGWVARGAASGKTITMWFVVRDDRGGVTWAIRRVRVE
jgi:hypothetical protein